MATIVYKLPMHGVATREVVEERRDWRNGDALIGYVVRKDADGFQTTVVRPEYVIETK